MAIGGNGFGASQRLNASCSCVQVQRCTVEVYCTVGVVPVDGVQSEQSFLTSTFIDVHGFPTWSRAMATARFRRAATRGSVRVPW